MAFTLTNFSSRTSVRSSTPARKVQTVRCQAVPDFKAPIRSALISAATVAAALSITMGAVASEDLGAAAQRTANNITSKAQNTASQLKSSKPLEAVQNKIGSPLKAGGNLIQSTADNIVKDTPFAGEKVSKSVPIEDAANAPDPTGKTKYT